MVRYLRDDVVERRLEARGRRLGHRVAELWQPHVQAELCGDEREGVARRLRRERRRAREPRVDLDDAVLHRVGVQRVPWGTDIDV
jgi:hypothetical protein